MDSIGGSDDGKEDRISNLPDSILCEIISKLPTKFALCTTILSSKWKHLLYQIPSLVLALALDIDDSLFPGSRRDNSNFILFMDHLFTVTLRDVPCVRKFHLHCNQYHGHDRINSWISAALRLKVQDLDLFFNSYYPIDSFFCCTTLVHLRLKQNHRAIPVPTSVCLPNLKSLFLHSLVFIHCDRDHPLKGVFAGCPVLEQLSLEDCDFLSTQILYISVPTLKHFMIRNCFIRSNYDLVLDTPNLELFHYIGFSWEGYIVRNLNSLLKAHLDIKTSQDRLEQVELKDRFIHEGKAVEFVIACSNVRILYLSRTSMEAIFNSSCSVPTFHNLTKLELGVMDYSEWALLPSLLEMSPNLQFLAFMEGFWGDKWCFTTFEDYLPEFVPVCLSLHLQEIKIVAFNGDKVEVKLIEYFLKTAAVLKKVKIRCSYLFSNSERQLCIWKKLLMLPRCSKNCQIELTNSSEINIVESQYKM